MKEYHTIRIESGTGLVICPVHGKVDAEYGQQIPSPCSSESEEAWVWEDGELIAIPIFEIA